MSFKISPASHLDAEEIAQLIIVTNGTDRFFGLITPPERNATPEQKAAHLRWRAERIGMNIQRKGTHFFTAVDVASNKIVALAGVTAPENEKSAHSGEISETVDEALYKKFMEAVEQKNQELFGDRKNIWHIDAMAVHPEYQHRGIGRQLLHEACMLADKADQELYLESTPAGTRLYLSAGFEKIGEIKLLDGEYVLACMIRKASSVS